MSDIDKTPIQSQPGEPIRIRVDAKATDNVDSLVREYEEKYYGFRDSESDKVKNSTRGEMPAKLKRVQVLNTNATEEERMWAAIAHGSAILTFVLGFLSAGVVALFTLFIPLGIYFAYRQRSQYVAYAALQAFAVQVIGTVGWVALLVVGVILSVVLSIILAITIVGAILVPFIWIAFLVLTLASFALPLGMVVLGAIAAWETYQGKWYRYPFIGRWVDEQMQMGVMAR